MIKLCVAIVVIFQCQCVQSKDLEPYTNDEKVLVQNLRGRIFEKKSKQTKEEYEFLQRWLDDNGDLILLNYIRFGEHDLDRAEKALKRSVEWRRENDIENIFTWKYPRDFPARFPWRITGLTEENKPVVYMRMGDWDFREAAAKGQRYELIKYMTLMLESGKKMAQELEDPLTGLPVGNFQFILDLDTFKLSQVTSIRAISTALACASIFESVFPLYPANTFLIRAPSYFNILFEAAKGMLLTPATIARLTHTDADVKNWKPPVHATIPLKSLPKELGGTQ